MKKLIFAGFVFLLLINIYFVSAAPIISDSQEYFDSVLGKGRIIVEDGATIASTSNDLLTTQTKEGEGGEQKVTFNMKELPAGTKILKDGTIVINSGKANEVKISAGTITKKKDGSFDIKNPFLEFKNRKFNSMISSSKETLSLNLNIGEDKISIKSENMISDTKDDKTISMFKGGQVTFYSDGHKAIEKGTYYKSYKDGREMWSLGTTNIGADDSITYTGVNGKVSFSDDVNWKPTGTEAYVKNYDKDGTDTLEIKNVDFQMNMEVTDKFFLDRKTSIETSVKGEGIINIDYNSGSGSVIAKSDGVSTEGNLAGVNLNSEYKDANGETHNLILNEDGTILKCSEPCRECGQAYQLLSNQLSKSNSKLTNDIIKFAYKNDQNQFVYRTVNGEIYIYDVDKGITIYSKNGEDFKRVLNGQEFPLDNIGPITQQTISKEIAAQKASNEQGKEILPNGASSITPVVNIEMIDKLSNGDRRDFVGKTGDILVQNSLKAGQVFRLNTETGNYDWYIDGDFKDSLSPQRFNQYSSNANVQIIPYSYSGGTIKDSTGKKVGSMENSADRISLYDYNGNKIGIYPSLNDAKRAFEGRPWWQSNSRPNIPPSSESAEELLRRYSK